MKVFIYASLFFPLVACRLSAPTGSNAQGIVFVGKEYLWPNATASVCWENNLSPSDWDRLAGIRQKVADNVTSHYKNAGFTFTGWQKCEPGSRGIRIESWLPSMKYAPLGMVKAFGARLDGLSGGLGFLLEMDPKDLNHPDENQRCLNEELCVLGTALHEFGHGIGLAHEMNRPGSPCVEDQTGGWGGGPSNFTVPQYDPDSIMNYCGLRGANATARRAELSPMDIGIIKELYNTRPVFLPEKSCQMDGFSWVSGGSGGCCRVHGDGPKEEKPYNICAANFDSSFNSKVPTQSEASAAARRLTTDAQAVIKAALPWKPQFASLSCWSGESIGQEKDGGFAFKLVQPSDPKFDKFICNKAVFYNGSNVSASTEAVVFARILEIPVKTTVQFDWGAAEGLRTPVIHGKLQEIGAHSTSGPPQSSPISPPLGMQADDAVSAVQIFKFAALIKSHAYISQSSLTCSIDGQMTAVSAGNVVETYLPENKINSTDILEFIFPPMKSPAICTEMTFTLVAINNREKKLETKITFEAPIKVVPRVRNLWLEMGLPECVYSFAKNN